MPVSPPATATRTRGSIRGRAVFALLLIVSVAAVAQPAWAVAPANDHFVDAQLLRGASGVVTGTTVDATPDTSETWFDQHTVWYRTAVSASETLIVHTCTSTGSSSGFGIFTSTVTPTVWSDFTLRGDNDDWGTAASPIAAHDCDGADSNLSWVLYAPETSTTVWIQVSPGIGESQGSFTLSWYKATTDSALDKATAKLSASRTDLTKCTVSIKASGLDAFAWYHILIATNMMSTEPWAKTNSRGVLNVSAEVPRGGYNSSVTVAVSLVQIDGATAVSSSNLAVTNRCSA